MYKMGDKTSGEEKGRSTVQLPELKVLIGNNAAFTEMLFNTDLTSHFVQEKIITFYDVEEIRALTTAKKKSEFVLLKIQSALQVGLAAPFHKMLEIMKKFGNGAVQEFSTKMEQEIREQNEEPTTNREMDELSVEFAIVVADIAEILNKSDILDKFKLICRSVITEKPLLFSEKDSIAIQSSKSVFDVFYYLRDHWRWDSHHLLSTLIKLNEAKDAIQKLNKFEKSIDYTKTLNKFSSQFQFMHELLPPGYTRMKAIIGKNNSMITLEECKKLNKHLARVLGGATLRPPIYEGSDSIHVTWYICSEFISMLLNKAHQAKETFQLHSISFFEIDGVVILNNNSQKGQNTRGDSPPEKKQKNVEMLGYNLRELRKAHKKLINKHSEIQSEYQKKKVSLFLTKMQELKSQAQISSDPVKVQQNYSKIKLKKEIIIDKYGSSNKQYEFYWPYLLAKGPNGELIVGNNHEEAKHLVVFNKQLHYQNVIGGKGYGYGEFQQICGIAVDKKGFLYVTDGKLNCIQKIRLDDGKFISQFGTKGKENGQFLYPTGLLSKSNFLFVCDRHNERIQIFDDEDFLHTIAIEIEGTSRPCEPVDIAINKNTEKLFITDWRNHEIQVFELNDKYVGKIDTPPHPNGIFITPDNHLLVVSSNCVVIYEEDGTEVSTTEGEFSDGIGVIMMDDGKIVIADGRNGKNRLIVFTTNLP